MKSMSVALATRSFYSNYGRLTSQERRVLEHMLRAESAKETARRLCLAVSTTKNLRSRVLEKMMAHSTPGLIVIAASARRASARRVLVAGHQAFHRC